jgi:6-phosphofructokinase
LAATIRWIQQINVAKLAVEKDWTLIGVGGPKTIDNDVGDSEFKIISTIHPVMGV